MMKSYTDLEQSKKLSEILSVESADCYWDYDEMQGFHRISWFEDGFNKDTQLRLNENNVCAWSLAALLNVLPHIQEFYPTLEKINDTYFCRYKSSGIWTNGANPIDACYEMILKLHE